MTVQQRRNRLFRVPLLLYLLMGSVLVLDGNLTHGIVTIRCLGSQGIPVTVGSSSRWCVGKFSKYADRHFTYPAPEDSREGFLRAIENELESGQYDMLLPIHEDTVETVVKHRSRFEEYTTVPFPPYEQLRIGTNKRRTVEATRKFGIPHPKTLLPDEANLHTIEETIGYPVVAKAQRGEGRNNVAVCDSREELKRTYRDLRRNYGPVLFQEFIPNGGERGVYTLYGNSGELTALTVQQRLRTNPPSGGSSTYRETVSDPELVAIADELLTGIGWSGLAMVEFRIDARTGDPQLIEINPRLWGSLALSVYAGVNFPLLLYQIATGDDPEPVLEYRTDVQARNLFTDAKQVFYRENKLQALREFLTPTPKSCCYDLISKDDPLPILGQVIYWTALLLSRK